LWREKEGRKKNQGNKERKQTSKCLTGLFWNPETNSIANKPTKNSDQEKKNKQTNTSSKLLQIFNCHGQPKSKKIEKQTTHKIIYYD
jgi:hypothetical protein